MSKRDEAALLNSYRAAADALAQLHTIAERLLDAQRGKGQISAADLDHVEIEISRLGAQIVDLKRYLAVWNQPDAPGVH